MYKSMKKLIEKRFYKSAKEVQDKLDVFFAVNRLTAEEYTQLNVLAAEAYA